MTDRRFIEESFPVKEVGEASAREKSIRHGHISTLHIWWARRPLAASRATAYAALTPAPKDIEEWDRQSKFIIDLCQWENSNNPVLLEKARRDILQAHAGRLSQELGEKVSVEDIESGKYPRPRVLDPFAGGGSYPLEAMRLGCETYANDYNPVAVLIEKATLEYPQKFGKPFYGMPKWAYPPKSSPEDHKKTSGKAVHEGQQAYLFEEPAEYRAETFNPLLNAVKYWGDWVLEEARKELAEFYPPDPDGSAPVAYIWARTISCQNPQCHKEIPLIRSFWLANKAKKKIALYPQVDGETLKFNIVGEPYNKWPESFDPDKGFISSVVVTCPYCGSIMDTNTTRRLLNKNEAGAKLIAVVTMNPHDIGKRGSEKRYRVANERDVRLYSSVSTVLERVRNKVIESDGYDPLPDEPIPSTMPGGFHTPAYGLRTWGSLFNHRQSISLITFSSKIREAYDLMTRGIDPSHFQEMSFCKGVITYLSLVVSRHSSYNASLCWWEPLGERSFNVFGRQALPMVFDYAEQNPFSSLTGNFRSQIEIALEIIDHLLFATNSVQLSSSNFTNDSATRLQYPSEFFDAIVTDPPYYYSVTYADLSDFFYVWLKRILGHIYPELFSTPLTPKTNEIIEKKHWDKTSHQDAIWYQDQLLAAFRESYRVLKMQGVMLVVYAHKSTEGWETLINALLDSGLVVAGSWPINSEMTSRLMANDSAALASSIYIVARKMPRQPTGFYNDVRAELRQHLDAKLHRLWEEGIGGADFFIAAIGSAIEVFGKYEQVMDYEGNIVRANRLLEEVRTIATDYAVRQILHDGFASEISGLTRLYVLWRWNYGEALVPFDEGRKLAQSCGIDLSQKWGKGFVRKEKEFVRLLGPQNRKLEDLDDPRDLIDVLHKALLLWEKGQRAEMVQALAEKGHGKSDAFYRVAQAISETLPMESKEKKLLDGFLAGRERVQDEVEKAAKQGRLFE
jgi:adenine-specific DNA methylase